MWHSCRHSLVDQPQLHIESAPSVLPFVLDAWRRFRRTVGRRTARATRIVGIVEVHIDARVLGRGGRCHRIDQLRDGARVRTGRRRAFGAAGRLGESVRRRGARE